MQCPKCNSTIAEGNVFCTECGYRLQDYHNFKDISPEEREKQARRSRLNMKLVGSFWIICLLLFIVGTAIWYLL